MRTFFTSDLHLGHDKVAGYRGFESASDHDLALALSWFDSVAEGDEVFILGDIAASHSEYALWYLDKLPGTKHLIIGNHDGVFPAHNRAFKRQRRYLEVFESVSQSATIKIGGERVTLSHFPFTADRGEPRYMAYRVQDMGQWLFHGHTHSENRITGPRQVHVGWDAWGRLVTVADAERIMGTMKNHGVV